MPLSSNYTVIGLTGPFGSGSSTIAAYLTQADLNLLPGKRVRSERLSDYVRESWITTNPGNTEPLRPQLQDQGDQLRQVHGSGYLAQLACQSTENIQEEIDILIIDGIRNLGEVQALRERFGFRFFLFAINASWEVRWQRSKSRYEEQFRTIEDYTKDDLRDQDEEVAYGQQVQLCVDAADVVLVNNDQFEPAVRPGRIGVRAGTYARLVASMESQFPSADETLMNLACGASNSSFCLKRQVGAVIVDPTSEPISIGYNENPNGELPCVRSFGQCYRDIVRNEFFREAHSAGTRCPFCGNELALLDSGPPWRCAECSREVGTIFFQDRAMNHCTAVHAEARAIINAGGRNLAGCTIYTSTFPCFLCSEKIVHAGISRVVFAEPYPDLHSSARLDRAGIDVRLFEGVRSTAFNRVYGRVRQDVEADIDRRRRSGEGLRPAPG